MKETYTPSTRTRVTREPQRGVYEREVAYRILDEGFVCHVGFTLEDQPFVLPMAYGRRDDFLYIHGSVASRMLRALREGVAVCVTVTLIDGLVLARSVFNHSMNYRSVVILGRATAVEDASEKIEALRHLAEHLIPGRWAEARSPHEMELKATLILRVPIREFSAKVRAGPPIDDEIDYSFPTWAGVIPFETVAGEPIPDPRLADQVPVPDYAVRYSRPKPSS